MDNSPEEEGIFRFDDVFFTNELHGSLISPTGFIYTTFDGGNSWIKSPKFNAYLRAVEYANESIGIVSSLEGITLRTSDGGLTWTDISESIPGPDKGICGLHYVDGVLYGVGIFASPARFFRSVDLGLSWETFELDSIAFGLVDVYFRDSLNGFICGTGLQNAPLTEEGTIWTTNDGGLTWRKSGSTGISNNYIWKMDFVGDSVIYSSVENYRGDLPAYLYSLNGGLSWIYRELVPEDDNFFDAQAVGFLDAEVGYLCGYGFGMYQTENGGDTWSKIYQTNNVNRIFKLDDENLYAAGLRLYKYDPEFVKTTEIPSKKGINIPHKLDWNSANPIDNSNGSVRLVMDFPGSVVLNVYSYNGALAKQLYRGYLSGGEHTFEFSTNDLLPGTYVVSLRTYERHLYTQFIKK